MGHAWRHHDFFSGPLLPMGLYLLLVIAGMAMVMSLLDLLGMLGE